MVRVQLVKVKSLLHLTTKLKLAQLWFWKVLVTKLVQYNGLVPVVTWIRNTVLLNAVLLLLLVVVVNHHLLMAL